MAQVVASKLTHTLFACLSFFASLNNQIEKIKHSGFTSKVLISKNDQINQNNQRVIRVTARRQELEVVPVTAEDVNKVLYLFNFSLPEALELLNWKFFEDVYRSYEQNVLHNA